MLPKGFLARHPWIATLGKLRRVEHLSPKQVLLLVEALTLFTVVRAGLALFGFQRVVRRFGELRPPHGSGRVSAEQQGSRAAQAAGAGRAKQVVLDVQWAVTRVARHLPLEGTCLPQGLAGLAMLRRRGVPSQLHIGVRRQPDQRALEAHAWLEAEQLPVSGFPVAPAYQEIGCFS